MRESALTDVDNAVMVTAHPPEVTMFTPRVPNARPAVQTDSMQYRELLAYRPAPIQDEPYVSPDAGGEDAGTAATAADSDAGKPA